MDKKLHFQIKKWADFDRSERYISDEPSEFEMFHLVEIYEKKLLKINEISTMLKSA